MVSSKMMQIKFSIPLFFFNRIDQNWSFIWKISNLDKDFFSRKQLRHKS